MSWVKQSHALNLSCTKQAVIDRTEAHMRLLLPALLRILLGVSVSPRRPYPQPPTPHPRTYYEYDGGSSRYWPDVDETKLVPDYSGIRSKLAGPGGVLRNDADDHVLDDRAFGSKGGGRAGAERVAGNKRSGGAADFMIQGRASHGVGGLVNLLGIESPGLTASLAIAEHVVDLLEKEEGA